MVEELFQKIIAENDEESVLQRVNEVKGEYVWDWEGEFDSLEDAYEEQGRGEAESQIVNELIKEHNVELAFDDYVDLMHQLAEHYNLSLD